MKTPSPSIGEGGFTPGPWKVTTCMDYWVEHEQPRDDEADNGFHGVALVGDIHWPNFAVRQREWEANARLIAACPTMHEAASEIDRLVLVIESAVRNADPANHAAVLAALKANRSALALAHPGTEESK